MPIPVSFVKAPALTLLTAASSSRLRTRCSISPPYRISTTVCMTTKRTRTKSDSNSARAPRSGNAAGSDQFEDTAVDSLLLNPDDDKIDVLNQGSEQSDQDEEPLDDLLLTSKERVTSHLPDDDEIIMAAFEGNRGLARGKDEDEDEDEDEDMEDDEEDDDDELAAHADDDDFDHDISISTLDKSASGISARRMTLDPDDDDEDIDDDNDMIEPISEALEPIYEDDEVTLDDSNTVDGEEPPLGDGEDIPDDFGEETEEDIQNAASILSNSGLLGLGVEGGERADVASVKEFAMGRKSSKVGVKQEFDDEGLPVRRDDSDGDDVDEDDEEVKGFSDDYPDAEEDEESDFTLTSQSSFGRVWELNEDTYVTITEPGQSYVYELDEEDEEDQEMASMRRGKQGGWSGGLASYSADSLPKGSKEWIARRSYELMTKATPKEMFRWTRWHDNPPDSIKSLYPSNPPPPTPLGKTTLKFSSPNTETPTIGKDTSGGPLENQKTEEAEIRQNPLERSIRFPCTYKFKVEGAGENFPGCLRDTVERVLERKLPEMELEVEPAGRYERVVIPVEVQSAQQVTLVYDALRSDPSVKFSFG